MTDEQMLARLRHVSQVLGSINALSEERRELILALHGRYSYRQLARELGLSETRVWQIAHKDEMDSRVPGDRGRKELLIISAVSPPDGNRQTIPVC